MTRTTVRRRDYRPFCHHQNGIQDAIEQNFIEAISLGVYTSTERPDEFAEVSKKFELKVGGPVV